MRIGSLFSGVGGLDLAVEAVTRGLVAWHAEVDRYASAVLSRHWPDASNLGDVRSIRNPPHVEALCGGFPCQDISSAGKREGISGRRSGLWSEFARIIDDAWPRLVFIENVAALRGRGLDVVLGDLAALGFNAEWATLTAAAVGAPHRRDRVLAYRDLSDLRLIAEREQLVSAERRDGIPRQHGGDMADAVHDGRILCGQAHDDDRGDAHWNDPHRRDASVVFPPRPDDGDGWARWAERGGPVPGVCRGAYGPPGQLDARRRRRRLRHLGNGVVPRQAAAAFLMLARRVTHA